MHYQKYDVDKILNSLDFENFYQKYVPGFNTNGKKQVKVNCVFHEDTTPSLSINLETGLWNCFGCDKHGNAIQFVQKLFDLNFPEACERVITDHNLFTKTNKKIEKKSTAKIPRYLNLEQIKAIHGQLLKTPDALKKIQIKYGLSIETIKKYLIGYQNKHFMIPAEIEPGKWLFKEHKGQQSKGAKACIYPGEIIDKKLPHIIICEGELKALLLNQLEFPAVCGTAGAGTWKEEWNALFREMNVILAFDNDAPGKRGSRKVAESLRGTAKNIKVIAWPADLDGSTEKKDITDFFIVLKKTQEDFQKLIDTAQEVIFDEIKNIAGIRFIEPENFKIKNDKIEQTIYTKTGPEDVLLCHSPLLITGCALDIDSGTEEVEIAFKQHKRLKKIWTAKRNLSDLKKIIELSNHGLGVNSVNARRMIEFLSSFENKNTNFIKLSHIAKGVGWKTIRDRQVFILDKMISRINEDINVEFVAEAGFERFVRAMHPRGTHEAWREAVIRALKFPSVSFAFYASLAAPLLRLLKAPNFIIDFWGPSSLGKTTALEVAASVWGNPYKEAGGLVFSWDSTKVFLERMASFFCDVPIFPDDSHTVDDRTLTAILYQIANGVGRGRGAVVGIRRNPTWNTICFSTGERPLTQCTTFSGAQARTVEIYGSPFPNAGSVFISDLKNEIRENYGHAGHMFVNSLLSLIENPDEMDKIKKEYKKYQQKLSIESESEIGDRISQYFAIVKIASDLASNFFALEDPAEAEKKIHSVFKSILKDADLQRDIPTRAMHYILSWVAANENFFRWREIGEQYGRMVKGEYIGIFRHKFTEILRKENFSEMAVLRGWDDRRWIKREDNHFTCARKITDITGSYKDDAGDIQDIKETKYIRMIIIPWSIVDQFQS
jgi:putative DNA primase/helicase